MTKEKVGTRDTWKFSNAFWTANMVELLERGAYYAVFIAITLYLSDVVGFSDIEAGYVAGIFWPDCIFCQHSPVLTPTK